MSRRPRKIPPSEPPPRRGKPPANLAFTALVDLLELKQQQVADKLHLAPGTVSDLVRGKKRLEPEGFRRKCSEIGGKAVLVCERLLALAEEVAGGTDLCPPTSSSGGAISEICRESNRLAAALPAKVQELAAEKARQQAATLWEDLKKLEVQEWRLFAVAPEVRSWAFVKLVGEESERSASVGAGQALELASFALWVAERVPGYEGWLSQVFGWAWLANARRVGNALRGAEDAFACSARLRSERPDAELPEPWRLLDLEASLRICSLQLPEALRLLDQAADVAPRTGPIRARLLCKRSIALDRMEDPEGAIRVLHEALTLIDHEAEPHLYCMLQSNLAESLTCARRATEAEEMLPELRRLQAQLGNGLNQIRMRWLEGKIDAGLGRLDQAIEALSWVRLAFAEENLRYDEAQVGIELAELYLKKGRTEEVKRLVRQMQPVFGAQGVHEEAQKALALFRRAVEKDRATPELAGRVVRYLHRAQHDPKLVFQEAA